MTKQIFLYWPCFARCRRRQVYNPYRWILYNIHRTIMSRRNGNRYSPSILTEWYFRHPGLATGLSALPGYVRLSRHTSRLRRPLRTLETLVQFRSRKMVHSVRRRTYQLQRCAVQRWHIVQSGLPPYPCGSAVECPWPQICPARTGTLESCSLCRCRPVAQCL